jgi:hypothetical protein
VWVTDPSDRPRDCLVAWCCERPCDAFDTAVTDDDDEDEEDENEVDGMSPKGWWCSGEAPKSPLERADSDKTLVVEGCGSPERNSNDGSCWFDIDDPNQADANLRPSAFGDQMSASSSFSLSISFPALPQLFRKCGSWLGPTENVEEKGGATNSPTA